jgi:hypothetical protein
MNTELVQPVRRGVRDAVCTIIKAGAFPGVPPEEILRKPDAVEGALPDFLPAVCDIRLGVCPRIAPRELLDTVFCQNVPEAAPYINLSSLRPAKVRKLLAC